jgi:hypothetical protein
LKTLKLEEEAGTDEGGYHNQREKKYNGCTDLV